MSDRIRSPLPRTVMSSPGCCLGTATASAASPASRTDLIHGRGSARVREATCLTALSRKLVNGSSVRFGQTLKVLVGTPAELQPPAAGHPLAHDRGHHLVVVPGGSPATHDPSRVPSSARPAACITPSRVTLSTT